MAHTWRSLTEADSRAFVLHMNEVCDADGVDQRVDESFIPALLGHPLGEPELGFLRGVFDGDRLIASGAVMADTTAASVHWMRGHGSVSPDFRGAGLGTEMLRWMCELAPRIHAKRFPDRPMELYVTTPGTNQEALDLLANEGFGPVRWQLSMRRPEGAPIPAAELPDGLDLVPYAESFREPLRLLHNEVFVDQWHEPPFTAESWDRYLDEGDFCPELSFLAMDQPMGRIVGYLVAAVNESNFDATGIRDVHFDLIGTDSAFRKRGVASALISHAVSASRALGYQTASLGVDTENPSGALRLYEHHGFVAGQSWVHHCRKLIAGS